MQFEVHLSLRARHEVLAWMCSHGEMQPVMNALDCAVNNGGHAKDHARVENSTVVESGLLSLLSHMAERVFTQNTRKVQ